MGPPPPPPKPLLTQAIRVLETHYDIGRVKRIIQLYGGYTNQSFAVWMEKSDRGQKYFLRKYRAGATACQVRFEHALITHIISRGARIVADLIRTRRNANHVRQVESKGCSKKEYFYAVFEFINGYDKYSWICNRLNNHEYLSAGSKLAVMHDAAVDFDPASLRLPHTPIPEMIPELQGIFQNCAASSGDTCFDRYFRKNLNGILETAKKTADALADCNSLPKTGIHGDYHPGNQKYAGDRVIGVFDFDRANLDVRLFDLALAVIYFCSSWEGSTDGNLWLKKSSLFLQGYQEKAQQLANFGPLTPAEARCFPCMMATANLVLLKWITAEAFYREGQPCPVPEYLFYLKHNTRLMRWIEKNGEKIQSLIEKP
jgi:homoserine kinase type II